MPDYGYVHPRTRPPRPPEDGGFATSTGGPMQITLNISESVASIDTGDHSPTIDEVETLARICLEYALRAHACQLDYEASLTSDE